MSPGTTVSVETSTTAPPRRTRARVTSMLRNAAIAFSARPSCTNPRAPLINKTTPTTAASLRSPSAAARPAAPARIATRTLRNWSTNRRHAGRRGGSVSRFGPNLSKRSAASRAESPAGESTRNASHKSSVVPSSVSPPMNAMPSEAESREVGWPSALAGAGVRTGMGLSGLSGPEVSPARRASQAHRAEAVMTTRLRRGYSPPCSYWLRISVPPRPVKTK